MKKVKLLKLGKVNQESLRKREMDFLVGGNYCNDGYTNQIANYNAGKCSCFCGNGWGNSSSNRSDEAAYTKSSGTIVP